MSPILLLVLQGYDIALRRAGYAPSMQHTYMRATRLFLTSLGPEASLGDITRGTMRAYVTAILDATPPYISNNGRSLFAEMTHLIRLRRTIYALRHFGKYLESHFWCPNPARHLACIEPQDEDCPPERRARINAQRRAGVRVPSLRLIPEAPERFRSTDIYTARCRPALLVQKREDLN